MFSSKNSYFPSWIFEHIVTDVKSLFVSYFALKKVFYSKTFQIIFCDGSFIHWVHLSYNIILLGYQDCFFGWYIVAYVKRAFLSRILPKEWYFQIKLWKLSFVMAISHIYVHLSYNIILLGYQDCCFGWYIVTDVKRAFLSRILPKKWYFGIKLWKLSFVMLILHIMCIWATI